MAKNQKNQKDGAADTKTSEVRGALGHIAYQRLREAIDQGQLVPGQPIREVELSEVLGMSRTPIREAVSSLEAQGLIALDPRVGRVVAKLDYQAIMELYSYREILEGYAAAQHALHASEAEVAGLEGMIEREKQILNDHIELGRNNRRFHQAIYLASRNRYLVRTLDDLQATMSLVGRSTQVGEEGARYNMEQHAAVVRAIRARDAVAAEKAMREHIRSTQLARIEMLVELNQPKR